MTVCECSICAAVYPHIWQHFVRVSVPAFVRIGRLLLSPSTVLIKASGGRRKGWTERETGGGGGEGGGRDMHVWLPDLCDGERERRRERCIGKRGGATHWADEGISSSCLCCSSGLLFAVSQQEVCKAEIQIAKICIKHGHLYDMFLHLWLHPRHWESCYTNIP